MPCTHDLNGNLKPKRDQKVINGYRRQQAIQTAAHNKVIEESRAKVLKDLAGWGSEFPPSSPQEAESEVDISNEWGRSAQGTQDVFGQPLLVRNQGRGGRGGPGTLHGRGKGKRGNNIQRLPNKNYGENNGNNRTLEKANIASPSLSLYQQNNGLAMERDVIAREKAVFVVGGQRKADNNIKNTNSYEKDKKALTDITFVNKIDTKSAGRFGLQNRAPEQTSGTRTKKDSAAVIGCLSSYTNERGRRNRRKNKARKCGGLN